MSGPEGVPRTISVQDLMVNRTLDLVTFKLGQTFMNITCHVPVLFGVFTTVLLSKSSVNTDVNTKLV